MSQRRVHFDLPKHIYCKEYKNGTVWYFFRITRRPRYYTGKFWPTVEEARAELSSFLIANPNKAPRFNGDDGAQLSLFQRVNRDYLRAKRGKKREA